MVRHDPLGAAGQRGSCGKRELKSSFVHRLSFLAQDETQCFPLRCNFGSESIPQAFPRKMFPCKAGTKVFAEPLLREAGLLHMQLSLHKGHTA